MRKHFTQNCRENQFHILSPITFFFEKSCHFYDSVERFLPIRFQSSYWSLFALSRDLKIVRSQLKVVGSNLYGVIGIFLLTWFFRPHYGPGVNLASNGNEYQACLLGSIGGRCVGLTTLPPSCAECLEMLEASNSWRPTGLSVSLMR